MYDPIAYSFSALEKTRENSITVLDSMSIEAVNALIPGFNNTAAWNFCHPILTTSLLTYGICGLETGFNPRQMVRFRKGSAGANAVSVEELAEFKAMSSSFLTKLKNDYTSGLFQDYKPYETSYGIKLNSIEEALHFVGVHEALHLGYMMAIRRAASAL
ncbi:MAG: DinB family protein [Bacteroidota bacterium]|nr:DinB family protein [Bacteroidota bacterium]MDX5431893.1 DinB family protein [Bacteroidota bacterium]MDX5470607.1 DinB family protein [Bacteroidota bacterium]